MIAGLAIAACGDARPQPALRDPTSVRAELLEKRFQAPVIETAADVWRTVPEWRVSAQPLFVIGDTLDPAANPTFWDARDAAFLADGRIVIPTNRTERRHYSADGNPIRTVGGKGGEGPGEFRSASSIVRMAGDTTATWDHENSRISFFSPAGEYMRFVPAGRARIGSGLLGVLDNGRVVLPTYFAGPGFDGDGPSRDTLLVVGLDEQGTPVDTLGFLADRLIIIEAKTGSVTSRATGPSLVARGKRVYYTDGDRDKISVFEDGKPLYLIRTLIPTQAPAMTCVPDTFSLSFHVFAQGC